MTPDHPLYCPDLLNPGRGVPPKMQLARTEYLDGAAVDEVCRKHGVARSTFYARGAAEGWLRKDRNARDRLTEPAEPVPMPPPAPPTFKLAKGALDRAADAILNGHVREAEAWTRVAMRMRRLAQEETTACNWLNTVAEGEAVEAEIAVPEGGTEPDPAPGVQVQDESPAPEVEPSTCSDEESSESLDSPESPASTDLDSALHAMRDRVRAEFARRFGEPQPTTSAGWKSLYRRHGLGEPSEDEDGDEEEEEDWDELG